jgi:polyisoprenoid-binding protein YceI
MTRPRLLLLVVLAVALVGAGAAYFLGRDVPEAVDLERAIAAAPVTGGSEGGASGEAAAPVAADDAPLADASGTWVIDTSVAPFDTATGSGTWVGYRIDEELSGVGAFTAVGRTPEVSGSITIDGPTVTSATVDAVLTGLQSDNGSRDGRIRSLFSGRDARFTLTEPLSFGAIPEPGQSIAVSATGLLRIGDIEQPVVMEIAATVLQGRLVIAGSTQVALADFAVTVPSAPIVLSVSDVATIELQLYLTRD